VTNDPSSDPRASEPRGDPPALSYSAAGVDIDEATLSLDRVAARIRATHGAEVVPLRSGFAGAFRQPGSSRILLASMDGVGTKLLVAIRMRRYRSVGGDLVRHSANDLLVHGGRPLFFLDYVGTSSLRSEWFAELLGGITDACSELGCALLGGETAELPGIYHGDDFDLVGTIVGEVDAAALLDGSSIRPGDRLIGLASTGLHTNGYSLARRIVAERCGDDLQALVPGGGGASWGEALLWPHRSYTAAVLPLALRGELTGMAHITGGGIAGNLSRVLPPGTEAWVDTESWEVPPLFRALERLGPVPPGEMFRAFNMGVGFILVVRPERVPSLVSELGEAGETAWVLGSIAEGDRSVRLSPGPAAG
jgi:phosphoribosylformylglycinamidine cyclo-ligase